MPELIYQALLALAVVAAGYGGIRADIRQQRESIARAHQRIDEHIGKGHP